jgi:ribonuclease P protein component
VTPGRLSGRAAFSALSQKGRRVRVESLHASVRFTGEPARVGYAIPKSLGNAVKRNLLRRRLRERFRPLAGSLPLADILIRPRPSALVLDTETLDREVRSLIHAAAAIDATSAHRAGPKANPRKANEPALNTALGRT